MDVTPITVIDISVGVEAPVGPCSNFHEIIAP